MDGAPRASPPAEQEVGDYLEAVRRWRLAVLRFLGDKEGNGSATEGGVSQRARDTFAVFLVSDWEGRTVNWAANSPYNLQAFPVKVLSPTTVPTPDAVTDVLRWRAGVQDFLSDT